MKDAIELGHDVVIWPENTDGKDINEMITKGLSSDDIEKIISSNTVSGIEAKLKFNMWKKI